MSNEEQMNKIMTELSNKAQPTFANPLLAVVLFNLRGFKF